MKFVRRTIVSSGPITHWPACLPFQLGDETHRVPEGCAVCLVFILHLSALGECALSWADQWPLFEFSGIGAALLTSSQNSCRDALDEMFNFQKGI